MQTVCLMKDISDDNRNILTTLKFPTFQNVIKMFVLNQSKVIFSLTLVEKLAVFLLNSWIF